MYNYPGNIHIHSRYSDGSGDFAQIAAAAASAGLSYVIIADHETLAGLAEEKIHNGVVFLVGVEINRLHSHYLALGLERMVESHESNPQQVIDQVRDSGGLGFIAHPFEKGSRYIEKGKAYPWKCWPVFHFDGMEIWNYTSHWRGRHPSALKTLYWFFFNRKTAMDKPPPEALKLWDCYTTAGYRITAIGSSDAHASLYPVGPFKVPVFTYRYIFNTINTYIVLEQKLSSEHGRAKNQIISALRGGRCFISFDSLHPGGNFAYYALASGRHVPMGGEVKFEKGIKIEVKAPGDRPLVRLISGGRVVNEQTGKMLTFKPSGPGVYRVEVFHRPRFGKPRPWIYSNPIYIVPA